MVGDRRPGEVCLRRNVDDPAVTAGILQHDAGQMLPGLVPKGGEHLPAGFELISQPPDIVKGIFHWIISISLALGRSYYSMPPPYLHIGKENQEPCLGFEKKRKTARLADRLFSRKLKGDKNEEMR